VPPNLGLSKANIDYYYSNSVPIYIRLFTETEHGAPKHQELQKKFNIKN
jgi:hypothetical protein